MNGTISLPVSREPSKRKKSVQTSNATIDEALKRDGFDSWSDYCAHREAMPLTTPAFLRDSEEPAALLERARESVRANEQCYICCDAPVSWALKCQHTVCRDCGYKLVKKISIDCPFCKQTSQLGDTYRFI